MAWKVWFDDGTTYDNTQGAITDMPNKGIVVVAFSKSAGGAIHKDQDWYVYSTSFGLRAVSLFQLLRQITTYAGQLTLVRAGGLVSDAAYATMIAAANDYAATG